MLVSDLFTHTSKEVAQSDVSRNAQLLTRAGYIHKLMAGVYSYLPLGLRVLNKIENIIREEMNHLGAQEVLLPALQPRDAWEKTGRWDKVDVLYKLNSKKTGDHDLALGPTHEEIVTPLVTSFVRSYRDLPTAVFQVQTKFRNEPRAKSGLLRGREFRMKDMYSFHADEADLAKFYDRATEAYLRVYDRCGLGEITLLTYASGGVFSKYSHEFQTITPYGEDWVYKVPGTNVAINKEIMDDTQALRELMDDYKPGDERNLEAYKAIEVGNIFKLGARFTTAVNASYTDTSGQEKPIVMGCYGIGPSRVMGTIAECLSDDRGLVWPDEVAPYQVHLIGLVKNEEDIQKCHKIYEDLLKRGIEVIYDNRYDLRAGERFADADLIGIPNRVVISPKTLSQESVELKKRGTGEVVVMSISDLYEEFARNISAPTRFLSRYPSPA